MLHVSIKITVAWWLYFSQATFSKYRTIKLITLNYWSDTNESFIGMWLTWRDQLIVLQEKSVSAALLVCVVEMTTTLSPLWLHSGVNYISSQMIFGWVDISLHTNLTTFHLVNLFTEFTLISDPEILLSQWDCQLWCHIVLGTHITCLIHYNKVNTF